MRLNLVDKGFEFFRRNVFDDLGDEFDAVDGFEFVRIVGGLVADEFLFQVENLRLKLFLFFQELDNPVFNVVKPGFQAGADTVQAVFDVLREFSAAEPVTHSKRRTPAAIALSLTMLK